jgi:hypothetical protein
MLLGRPEAFEGARGSADPSREAMKMAEAALLRAAMAVTRCGDDVTSGSSSPEAKRSTKRRA